MHTESPTLLIYTVFPHEGHYASKVGDLPAHEPSWHGSYMIYTMEGGEGFEFSVRVVAQRRHGIQTLISQR